MLAAIQTDASLESELDELLTESISHAHERQKSWLKNPQKPIVIFGTGRIGRKLLVGLRANNIEPVLFVDYNSENWGTFIDGLEVSSPDQAARQWGSQAQFVIAIWGTLKLNRMGLYFQQFMDLGCSDVISFHHIFWAYPDEFLPHYALEAPSCLLQSKESIKKAYALMADHYSRRQFIDQIIMRLEFNLTHLSDPVDHAHYFPNDIRPLRNDEIFVDCGAFTGDTLEEFLRQTKGVFGKYIAFEPDLLNFQKLERHCYSVHSFSRAEVEIHHAAVGMKSGKVNISNQGLPSTKIGYGSSEVNLLCLDDVLGNVVPTVIKMDIEGSELDALQGAKNTIRRCLPALAISAYHLQDHMWSIPLLIHELDPSYKIYLRPQEYQGWELVCYAIPRN